MTNRQTLSELLARITADRHAAELDSLNRVIAEERTRANRCRDEAVNLRDLLDDVIESLELLAPVPAVAQPESTPTTAEDVDAWEELCTALGVKRRGIADVTQAVYALQTKLRNTSEEAIPVAKLAGALDVLVEGETPETLLGYVEELANAPEAIPVQALWDALDLPADETPTAARVWEALTPILDGSNAKCLAANLPVHLQLLHDRGRPLGGLILTLTQSYRRVIGERDEACSESIPVAELAAVLGCDVDAASVRMRLEDVTAKKDGPEPDAEGWYVHDGKSWPACQLGDDVEIEMENGERMMSSVNDVRWEHVHGSYNVTRWRYADGRDVQGAKAPTPKPDGGGA